MINERAKYTANTGTALISTANTNLDGSGTLGSVITGASNGTLINTVTIKATGNTTRGMVRLFVYDGTNTRLLTEVKVPAVTKSGIDHSFERTLYINYSLKASYVLKASTQNAENFSIVADGLDWAY
jgi:hypothetical protein